MSIATITKHRISQKNQKTKRRYTYMRQAQALDAVMQRQAEEHKIRVKRNKAVAEIDRLLALPDTCASARRNLQSIRLTLNTNSNGYWLDNPSFEGHRHLNIAEEI